MNVEEAGSICQVIERGWPGALAPESVALYLEGMLDLPFTETAAAVRQMRMVREHRPALATIRKAVAQSLGQVAVDG